MDRDPPFENDTSQSNPGEDGKNDDSSKVGINKRVENVVRDEFRENTIVDCIREAEFGRSRAGVLEGSVDIFNGEVVAHAVGQVSSKAVDIAVFVVGQVGAVFFATQLDTRLAAAVDIFGLEESLEDHDTDDSNHRCDQGSKEVLSNGTVVQRVG